MDDLSARDEALLVKQADWVVDAMQERARERRGLQIGYLLALSALVGWVINQAFKVPVDVALIDASVYAARQRPDVAVVLCAVCVLNIAFFLLSILTLSQQAISMDRLERIHSALSRSPAWIKPLSAVSMPANFWQRRAAMSIWVMMIGTTVGCLWFARPAAKQSFVIALCWWFALLALIFAVRAMLGFALGLRRIRRSITEERLRK